MRGQLLWDMAHQPAVTVCEYRDFVHSLNLGVSELQMRVIANIMFEEQAPLHSWIVAAILDPKIRTIR